jgi:hypothetical protein
MAFLPYISFSSGIALLFVAMGRNILASFRVMSGIGPARIYGKLIPISPALLKLHCQRKNSFALISMVAGNLTPHSAGAGVWNQKIFTNLPQRQHKLMIFAAICRNSGTKIVAMVGDFSALAPEI